VTRNYNSSIAFLVNEMLLMFALCPQNNALLYVDSE